MSNSDGRRLVEALLRQSFPAFIDRVFATLSPGQIYTRAWFIDALAFQLERVRRGEIKRLIVTMPPRSLKSTTASVAFPAYLLGHDPTKRIICVSYSTDLAQKLSNDFRAVITQGWYRSVFPNTRIGVKDSASEIELTHRGFRFATSTGGTLTGRGGDLIVIDDPLKPIDALSDPRRTAANDWFRNTLLSRLDDKRTGAIVLVMQRLHMDDLAGFLLGQSEEWTTLDLPAIAEAPEQIEIRPGVIHERQIGEALSPEREPIQILKQIRQALGSDTFRAQFQQSPVPPGGAMIKRDWVKRYAEMPSEGRSHIIFQSWDTAAKGGPENDFSVCTTWLLSGNCQWYLLDCWRDRVDYPTLKSKVVELAQRWGARSVLVEESGTAIGLLAELKRQVRGITAVRPDKDKQTRMSIASAVFEAGQVFFPQQAAWLPVLEAELFSFPGSRHDDQVDSISQAINHSQNSAVLRWIRWAHAQI